MIRKAKVTFNSKFVASKVKKIFEVNSNVIYPSIDGKKISNRLTG